MFQLGFKKAKEPENKLPTSVGSFKKQENSRKTFTSASLTMIKPLLCGSQQTVWKNIQELELSDHLMGLLRNLYAGQQVTVQTRHGRMAWFQIEKGVCQGCLIPFLI